MLVDFHGDLERIEAVLRDASGPGELQPLQPIGCFFARYDSKLEFSGASREVYSHLFPESRQVALLLRLDGRKSAAQFYGRSPHPPLPTPIFSADDPARRPSRRRGLILTALLGWLVAALACFALLRPGIPFPFVPGRPALGLRLASAPGSLSVLWNRRAPSLRGSSRATLQLHDAGQFHAYELSPAEVERGTFAVAPRGNDIEVEMTAYPPGATPVSEFARFITARGK